MLEVNGAMIDIIISGVAIGLVAHEIRRSW